MPLQISTKNTVYADIDPNFNRNPKTGDLLTVKDSRSVKQSVMNLLSTNFGDRLFQPRLGTATRALLFEPVDAITAMELRDRVLNILVQNEPRISNIIVDVIAQPNSNEYTVNIEYSIVPLEQSDRATIVLQRNR